MCSYWHSTSPIGSPKSLAKLFLRTSLTRYRRRASTFESTFPRSTSAWAITSKAWRASCRWQFIRATTTPVDPSSASFFPKTTARRLNRRQSRRRAIMCKQLMWASSEPTKSCWLAAHSTTTCLPREQSFKLISNSKRPFCPARCNVLCPAECDNIKSSNRTENKAKKSLIKGERRTLKS